MVSINTQLLKPLLALAIPIMTGGAVQTSYHLVNAFWVGRLDAQAVATIAFCFPVSLLMISLGSGLTLAGTILIAQHFGAKNHQQVSATAAQTLTAAAILSVVMTVAGYFAIPFITHVLGVSEALLDDTKAYLVITFAGSLFLFLNLTYQAILRGIGNSRAPLPIIFASVIINAALDPLLIFGWGPIEPLGVIGAAYATLITLIISSIAGIRLMLGPRFGLTLSWKQLSPRWPVIITLFRVGLPASVEQGSQALFVSVMTVLAAKFGTVVLAAYGIVSRLLIFMVIPALSLSMAASILAGQSTGAGNPNQVVQVGRSTAVFNLLLMLSIAAVFFTFASPIMHFFVSNDEELIATGTIVLRIFALSFPCNGILLALSGTFRGAGDTFNTMLLTLMGIWAVQLPLAVVLSQHTSLAEIGLWCSAPLATLINATLAILYFKSRYWLRKCPPAPATVS